MLLWGWMWSSSSKIQVWKTGKRMKRALTKWPVPHHMSCWQGRDASLLPVWDQWGEAGNKSRATPNARKAWIDWLKIKRSVRLPTSAKQARPKFKTLIHLSNHWSLNIYFRTPPMSPVIVDLICRLQMTLPLPHVSYSPCAVSHSFTLPNRALITPFPPYILKHNSDPPEVNTLSQLHNDRQFSVIESDGTDKILFEWFNYKFDYILWKPFATYNLFRSQFCILNKLPGIFFTQCV